MDGSAPATTGTTASQAAAPVRLILGIDPGVTGGLAWLFPTVDSVSAEDIPVVDGAVDVDALALRIAQMRPTMAVIEKAGAMPGQGVSSTFKYGAAYGALQAVCICLRIPLHHVAATKWKKHFGLDKDKEKSRALAVNYWPGSGCFSRKKDHGRAEAALIARFGAETVGVVTGKHRPRDEASVSSGGAA